jgi:small neutral amino acid transporter SnatA (MarC family)
MAFPVLVGPGSMIAAILVVKELGIAQGILAILFACGTLVLVMSYAHILLRRAGRIAPVVISRILMVFVAGLGVEFIYRGIVFLFPAIMG